MDHPDSQGACRDMLEHWLRGECHTGGEERTWFTLLTALGRASFKELERKLRRSRTIPLNDFMTSKYAVLVIYNLSFR